MNIPSAKYRYHRFGNGIRLVYRQNVSPVTHCGVFINVGSRDENEDEEGMAHFIEHCIFKGTEHRKSYHILSRIDGVGGELNAYTTKEETCVYASALNQHLERCLELFADILFCSTFPEKELDKEREVIVDEINSYKDTPSELIFDDFEEMCFASHPLSHNILGTPRNVRKFSPEKVRDFMKRHYTTDKMVISVVGNADFGKVVRLCEKHFGSRPATVSTAKRETLKEFKVFNQTRNKHIHQVHGLIGCPAYNSFDDKRTAFTLINNILGGPAMNSRLNIAIREKFGLCYNIESQYSVFSDTGLFYVYVATEPNFKDKITELIFKELSIFRETPISDTKLRMAKQQLIAQMAINNEQPLNEMQSVGKSFMVYDRVDSMEEIIEDLEKITPKQVSEVADEIFNVGKFSQLFYI